MNNERPEITDIPIGTLRANEELQSIDIWTGERWKPMYELVDEVLMKERTNEI